MVVGVVFDFPLTTVAHVVGGHVDVAVGGIARVFVLMMRMEGGLLNGWW